MKKYYTMASFGGLALIAASLMFNGDNQTTDTEITLQPNHAITTMSHGEVEADTDVPSSIDTPG